ncbi:MAG: cobalt ECF transporter T component CbiQ [Dehalococcoidia bacterium]|nr:cobalt ECF transporter T component CbiQ [Dehalococcoidia bacterium]
MHRADARLKFILVVGFILSVSLLPRESFLALGIAWSALVGVSFLARLGPVRMVRGSFVALPFVFAALPLVFTREGDPIGTVDFGLFSLTASWEGVRLVATIMLKSWVSVQAATLLVFSTTFHDLVHGLERLRLPKLMVAVISLMYRYLAVLTGEAQRMMRARQARSAELPGAKRVSTAWRAKVVGHMVGSLFIRSYERSERIYLAMQARGYTGQLVSHRVRPMLRAEWATLFAVAATLVSFELAAHAWMPHA